MLVFSDCRSRSRNVGRHFGDNRLKAGIWQPCSTSSSGAISGISKLPSSELHLDLGIMYDAFSASLEELCRLKLLFLGTSEALEGGHKGWATIEGCVGYSRS